MQLNDRIGRRIKLDDIHILMTVVQAGSMNKAATLLNTTQSAVSRSIGELERTIGIRLLDRSPQGVEPTVSGRTLLDGGAALFDDLRQTLKSIEFLADPTIGEVRLGCNPALGASFVSAVIDRLSQQYPRIKVHVVTAYAEQLHVELTKRNLDFLIARKFGSIADERLSFEPLFDDTCVVSAGACSPWARRRKIALAELVNEPWALPPSGSGIISTAMEAFFGARGLDQPRTTVVTDSVQLRMTLLATGRFLTIFTTSALKFSAQRSELKILPVELPAMRFPNGIVTLKNRTLGPVARLFIETAREVAKSLAQRK
jgi:DNA-binding transcriptional LysR family regulator